MINTGLTYKQRISIHDFEDNTSSRPNVNLSSIFGSPEDQLRGSIATSTYVGNIWLIRHEDFGWAKVANGCFVALEKKVFWFNISMTNAQRMKIRQSFEKLIDNDLGLKPRHLSHWVTFNSLVHILFIVSHQNVEILVFSLLGYVGP